MKKLLLTTASAALLISAYSASAQQSMPLQNGQPDKLL